jgi:hypothetical protein
MIFFERPIIDSISYRFVNGLLRLGIWFIRKSKMCRDTVRIQTMFRVLRKDYQRESSSQQSETICLEKRRAKSRKHDM